MLALLAKKNCQAKFAEGGLATANGTGINAICLVSHMYLDRYGRRIVEQYRDWRRSPPTVASLLFRRPARILFVVGVLIACGAGFVFTQNPIIAFAFGMNAGVLVAQLSFCRAIPRGWAVLEQFLDWEKVDQALREIEGEDSGEPTEILAGDIEDEPLDLTPADIAAADVEPGRRKAAGSPPRPENYYRPGR